MARLFISRGLVLIVAAGAIMLGCSKKQASDTKATASADAKSWIGDFDGMLERRNIRVLVPYSRSLFFVENGKEHGLTADLAHDFGAYLNQKHAQELGGRPITVTLIPDAQEHLQALTERTGMSKTDIVNRSVSLYEFVQSEMAAGGELRLQRPSGEVYLVKLL